MRVGSGGAGGLDEETVRTARTAVAGVDECTVVEPAREAFVDALPSAKFVPINASWVEFDKIGTDAVTAMFLDGTGPEVACQAMVDGLAGISQ